MKKRVLVTLIAVQFLAGWNALGHPLGVLSTNRYTRIEIAGERIRLVYVLDVAEIPAIREFTSMDRNRDGSVDERERNLYMDEKTEEIYRNLRLVMDGAALEIKTQGSTLEFPDGQGGLRTIRFTSTYEGPLPQSDSLRRLSFNDFSPLEARGWREIILRPMNGEAIVQSSIPENDVTNELRGYPADRLDSPPVVTEASVEFHSSRAGTTPGFRSLATSAIRQTSDSFAKLVSSGEMGVGTILVSFLIAFLLGAGHALTPGHGKTIVAAYLVGARGTPRDAVILGLTVTATHTAGVFALGLITLFASQFILPGDLFPWLGLLSGLTVVWIGLSLLYRRLRQLLRPGHTLDGAHSHGGHSHTHDGLPHSHMPAPANGPTGSLSRLLALGISGGLLPCPSAIVVLLGAVALGRVGFGVLLVLAFSLGLAGVLTAIGLVLVCSRKLFERIPVGGAILAWLPVLSAFAISIAGVIIALQAGAEVPFFKTAWLGGLSFLQSASLVQSGSLYILGLGFVLGLKHALDADHLVAVSTIVSERRGLFSSSIVGGLWGLGHTVSLLAAGLIVIALQVPIPEKIAQAMEFCVAVMLVGLGANVLRKLFHGEVLHMHSHLHAGHAHAHPHLHPGPHAHEHQGVPGENGSQQVRRSIKEHLMRSKRSVFIGMVHGLAGSAALMLIIVATIPSTGLALAYVGIFGLGSMGGMFVMSTLIGLPFAFSLRTSRTLNGAVRAASGMISIGLGLVMAWQIGIIGGLFL